MRAVFLRGVSSPDERNGGSARCFALLCFAEGRFCFGGGPDTHEQASKFYFGGFIHAQCFRQYPQAHHAGHAGRAGHDLRGVFEYMVCGDEVEHGKPFPDIYQKAADMLGVNIKHTLVIEDSYNGIRAGHAAGASVIMVPDLVQPTDEIRQMTDYVVSDLGKVISCISNF